MFPDYFHAKIAGKPAVDAIGDPAWFNDAFLPTVQQRGASILKARGLSSAASGANGVIDTVRSLTTPTRSGNWFSAAVCSDGFYGVEKGLVFSYPLICDGTSWGVVPGISHGEYAQAKLAATELELKEERSHVLELLGA